MKRFFLIMLLIWVATLSGSPLKVFVQRIDAPPEEKEIAAALEESLVLTIGKLRDFSVISSQEVDRIVDYSGTGASIDCQASKECLVTLQKNIRAEIMITGTLGSLDKNTKLLSLTKIDLVTSAVGEKVALLGKNLTELVNQIPGAIDTLLGSGSKQIAFRLERSEQIKIAVMPLENKGVDKKVSEALTHILNSSLNQIENISVISQSDIIAMLEKTALDTQLSCTGSMQCMVEIGAAFGAGILVTGTIGQIENTFLVSLQLIDTRKAEVLNRTLETYSGTAEELKQAVKLAVWDLLGVSYSDRKGALECSATISEGSVRLGTYEGTLEKGRYLRDNLLPGRYTLRIEGDPDDYYPFQTDIYILPDTRAIHQFTILEKPSPWYKTWWFWTGVGVIVAATTVTSIYFATRENPSGEGSWDPWGARR